MRKKKKLKNKKVSKLDVPMHKIKVSRSITADFLDEELKDIDNIDKQIEFLRGLKIYSEEKLNEKKKETIKLSKSFLKAVTKKDNIDSINVDNLELLLEDKDLIDPIYRKLIKYEKLLIDGKDVHLLKIFYTKQNRQNKKTKQNRQNKKPINKKVFKPAITPFPHALVDIIEDELNLINKYLRVRYGLREYLSNNDLNHNKYYFGYDISLAIMFSRLLKTYKEKKFYLKKIKKGIKVNLKNIMSDIASKDKDERQYKQIIISKKEDIDKIKYELDYLKITSEANEDNAKEKKISNNAVRILLNIERLKWNKIIKHLVKNQRIGCKNNDEEINMLITNHFICNDDIGGEIDECENKINWIGNLESFYQFVAVIESFDITKEKRNNNYCSHFEKIENGINTLIEKKITKNKNSYKFNKEDHNYKDTIKDVVIKDIMDLLK